MNPKVTVHCLVKNEENFVWYAINSVLPYVDRIIVFDTGSTDKTVEIVKTIKDKKVELYEKGEVDLNGHTELRNEMIRMTKTPFFMVLDGDEVWPEKQIKGLLSDLGRLDKDKGVMIVPFIYCVGDIYHYSTRGIYRHPGGVEGHYATRVFKKIQGIHWEGKFDSDTLLYDDSAKVTRRENVFVAKNYFIHLSALPRSSKDHDVWKRISQRVETYSLGFIGHGRKITEDTEIPEVFFKKTPSIVPRVEDLSKFRSLISFIPYVLRKIKNES